VSSDAQDPLGYLPTPVALRSWGWSVEPARTMRSRGFDWDHEIRVALPRSYASGDRSYPVLWLMDNQLEEALAILGERDLILVSVGAGDVALRENGIRRTYDFTPGPDLFFPGPGSDRMRRTTEARFPELTRPGATGGAAGYLDFLVDDVRSALAADYRIDPDDHAIIGFSQGGTFVAYSLFARPGAFAKYILGSGALWQANGAIFDLEERYAAEHDDLPAQVFIATGEAEVTEPFIDASGLASSTIRLAETLGFRRYPSLRLTVKVFPGESHGTMFPHLLGWGVRTVWGDLVAGYAQDTE
jgi:predicted alpha/beta superfamily hydrolase